MTDWTSPLIKVQGSTLDFWNTYLRDNMTHIKAPPNEQYAPAYANTITSTSSTSFANISSDFSKTIVTYSGDVLVSFSVGDARLACFDISVDGSRQGGVDGIAQSGTVSNVVLMWPIFGLAAGSHTIAIQWKSTGGTAQFDNQYMPFFNIREFS